MNLDRRLDRLGRQLGCGIHASPLRCRVCQPDAPTPPEFTAAMARLIDMISARLGVDEARVRYLAVLRPPRHEVCPRCGGRRDCSPCLMDHTRALLRACHLTTAEATQLDNMMALARALDAQRARTGGH